jgi:aromatic-L-amino-acid decarboxylase
VSEDTVQDGALEEERALLDAATLAWRYLQSAERYPVAPAVAPGAVSSRLGLAAPEDGEPLASILSDYRELIEPALTHWNHPGFFAYFATSSTAAGVAAETLAAATNVNAMLWRTSPAATELELRACEWLRQAMELPPGLLGHINDTASTSTLIALAAARHRAAPGIREHGLASAPPLAVYCSDQAHSSVDKAVALLGLGLGSLRRIRSDDAFRLDPSALEEALERDRAAGRTAMAIVATIGTTSTASVDPLPDLGELARRYGAWLHVDAAYAGSAAICPEHRALLRGVELADSLVVNPHKWLCVPLGCSVLFTRGAEPLRAAFSLIPEYLRSDDDAVNLMDLGIALGRRFNGLKLWFVLRHLGLARLREHIRRHCALARDLANWVAAEPGFELAAPTSLGVVCLRALPSGCGSSEEIDAFNTELLRRVNRRGVVFLSQTELRGRVALRVAIGNVQSVRKHVETAWQVLRLEARHLDSGHRAPAQEDS